MTPVDDGQVRDSRGNDSVDASSGAGLNQQARSLLSCAVCIFSGGLPIEPAETVVEGYAVCSSHVGIVAQGARFRSILEAARS